MCMMSCREATQSQERHADGVFSSLCQLEGGVGFHCKEWWDFCNSVCQVKNFKVLKAFVWKKQ